MGKKIKIVLKENEKLEENKSKSEVFVSISNCLLIDKICDKKLIEKYGNSEEIIEELIKNLIIRYLNIWTMF